jgi:hypothetical protein
MFIASAAKLIPGSSSRLATRNINYASQKQVNEFAAMAVGILRLPNKTLLVAAWVIELACDAAHALYFPFRQVTRYRLHRAHGIPLTRH